MSKHPSAPPPRWIRQDRMPTLDEIAWLASPEGQSVCAAMADDEPADTPAAIARWRRRLDAGLIAAAWTQVTLRHAAQGKFSRADQMLLDRVGLEQATDETVALHKARRFAGSGQIADLCCGLGGDTIGLAGQGQVVAVDWSAPRTAMAGHNAGVYGHTIQTVNSDLTFSLPEAEAAHVDPDRRPTGPRRHQPEAGSPGIETLQTIIRRYEHTAIKLSPGADFDMLPFEAEIELISHHGQCKQAVAWTGRFHKSHRRATVLPSGESIAARREDDVTWPAPKAPLAGGILFEPDPAVIRANLVGPFAHKHNLAPIDTQITYLVGDEPAKTALAATFRVIDVTDFALKRTRAWLAEHDVGRIDIKTRGFAARPDDLLRRLKPKGTRPAVLLLTRANGKPLAILAERLSLHDESARG